MTSLVLVQDHTFGCLLFWQDLQDFSYDRMVWGMLYHRSEIIY
jgi:hypothetical protein